MKKDLIFITCVCLFLLPFIVVPEVMGFYAHFNSGHPFIMAAIKFALLATTGEIIGLRIRTGSYYKSGFGIIPRAMVWAFLGICIKAAFIIFAHGAPWILSTLGFSGNMDMELSQSIFQTQSWLHVLAAFTVSATLNLFFAPVFMTFHKVTDTHIMQTGGTIKGLFSPMNVGQILSKINWETHYGFVLKRAIPLFWIPAHTITFLLHPNQRILFAALLGVLLGIILSLASLKDSKPTI